MALIIRYGSNDTEITMAAGALPVQGYSLNSYKMGLEVAVFQMLVHVAVWGYFQQLSGDLENF